MTRPCPHCANTGVVVTDTWELGDKVFRSDCECKHGRAFTAVHLGPQPGTSHQLAELAIDAHSQAMQDAGKWHCGNCFGWHDSDERCPEIHEGSWTADNIGALRVPEHRGESE